MLGATVQQHPSARLCPSGEAAKRRHELRAAAAAAHQAEISNRWAANRRGRSASVDATPSQRAAAHRTTMESKRAQHRRMQAQEQAWEDAARQKLKHAADSREELVLLRAKSQEEPTAVARAAEQRRQSEWHSQQLRQQTQQQRESTAATRLEDAQRRNKQHVLARQNNAARLNARVAKAASAREEWDKLDVRRSFFACSPVTRAH